MLMQSLPYIIASYPPLKMMEFISSHSLTSLLGPAIMPFSVSSFQLTVKSGL